MNAYIGFAVSVCAAVLGVVLGMAAAEWMDGKP